jgi:hypothetical protein
MQAFLQAGKGLRGQHPEHLEQQQLALFLQGLHLQHLVLSVALFLQEQRRQLRSLHAQHHQPLLLWSATALQMMVLTG